MKRVLVLFFPLYGLVLSCTPNKKTNQANETKVDKNSEFYIVSEAKKQLHLDSTEAVKIQFFRSYLNSDSVQDAYVVINLSDRVKNDYETNKNPATFAEMGYFGKYNYIIPFDGASQRIGAPFMIGSNGKSELELTEQDWISPSYHIIQADYRVRNAGFSFFLALHGSRLEPVFAYKRFDQIGTNTPEGYVLEASVNPNSVSKDLNVYHAELENYNENEALNNATTYVPQLKKTKQLVRHYFYVPSMKAYAGLKQRN